MGGSGGLRLAQSLGCMTDQDWDDIEEKNKALGRNIENPVIRINNISVQYLKYQNVCKKKSAMNKIPEV